MPMEAGVGDCLGLFVIIAELGFNRSEPKFEPEKEDVELLPDKCRIWEPLEFPATLYELD